MVINNQYELYRESVFSLAETLVIKFSQAAEAFNLGVIEKAGLAAVDLTNPHSWRYYQNIAGVYHSVDEPMEVASLDVAETIVFTKENLKVHRATADAYQYGSRYYRELVQRFPEQETLILGILYPADIDKAIAAKNGTILSYPPHLVEEFESSLIESLQSWIYNWLGRWYNAQFQISDDLYFAAAYGQLCCLLVPAIITLRAQARHTEEVHSFHLQQFLASHGYLDKYLPYLTREQALFLYRNIKYYQRYAGRRESFAELVYKILTRRGFPLYRYQGVHVTSEMHNKLTPEGAAQFAPEARFLRRGVNSLAQATAVQNFSLSDVLTKIEPIAPKNAEYRQEHFSAIKEDLELSPSAVIQTKLLETTSVDYSSMVPYTIEAIAMQHWLSYVAAGKYVSTVVVNIPHNTEAIRLKAQEAVALFLYCLLQASNAQRIEESGAYVLHPPLRVPRYTAHKVIRDPAPTFNEFRSITDKEFVDDQTIIDLLKTKNSTARISSIDAFYEHCTDILASSNLQWRYSAYQEHYRGRTQVEMLYERFYASVVARLDSFDDPYETAEDGKPLGALYAPWLATLGVDFSRLVPRDYYELAESIYKAATGVGSKTPTRLSEIQKALSALVMQLSSYSIALVTDSLVEDMIPLGFHGWQLGSKDVTARNESTYNTAPVTVVDLHTSVKETKELNLDSFMGEPKVSVKTQGQIQTGVEIKPNGTIYDKKHLSTWLMHTSSITPVSAFNSASSLERSDFIDAYGYDADMTLSVTNFTVEGFGLARAHKLLNVAHLWSANTAIASLEYTAKTKKAVSFKAAKAAKSIQGFMPVKPNKYLGSKDYALAQKRLAAFVLTSGYVTITPTLELIAKAKKQASYFVVKPMKFIELDSIRAMKRLPGFTVVKGTKRLNGFSIASQNPGGEVI